MKSATGLTGSGVRDWIIQRISAVILAVYSIVLLGFIVCNSDMTYDAWHAFMTSLPMKVLSLLSVLALVGHAWVGMWTIFTDYVKSNVLRFLLQAAMIIAVLVYAIWGIDIFWSI